MKFYTNTDRQPQIGDIVVDRYSTPMSVTYVDNDRVWCNRFIQLEGWDGVDFDGLGGRESGELTFLGVLIPA